MNILIDGWHIYLNHYPFLAYVGAYNEKRKVGQLFGHVHYYNDSKGLDSERLNELFPFQYDVGVDNNNYTPVSWKKVKSIFESCGEYGYKNMVEYKKENN
jgi:calcineurin-like phosphoesterase family protein